jgi:hypothetical protein
VTAKLVSLFITFKLCIAIGVVVLATMLIAMNGYSESDAMWGLGVFVLLAFFVSILMAIGAYILNGRLVGKNYNSIVAVIVPVLVFSVGGCGLLIISSLVGVGVAEFVRVNY